MEKWKKIKNTRYQISNHGRVYSEYKKEKFGNGILNPFNDGHGYLSIGLNGKKFKIHRLVAEYFVKNNDIEKNEVNHIDFNKKNNNYKNLEWVSGKENISHLKNNKGITNQFNKIDKKIISYDMNKNKLSEFDSYLSAAIYYNFKNNKNKYSSSNIKDVCLRNLKSYKGYIFLHEEDDINLIDINKKENSLKRKIKSIDEFGNEKFFNSITEAADFLNLKRSDISAVLTKRQKTTKKYKFEYLD